MTTLADDLGLVPDAPAEPAPLPPAAQKILDTVPGMTRARDIHPYPKNEQTRSKR